jgi:D-alanine transaminase
MADALPVCHLNGTLLPLNEACISPLDRGFLFGDGVYEVLAAHRGIPHRLASHLARLEQSLAKLRIRNPLTQAEWTGVVQGLISANGSGDMYIYLQVSRGADHGRSHAPLPDIAPTVFGFCAPLAPPGDATLAEGIRCITTADTRWAHCEIKSVALLANVLLRQQAIDAGTAEAILLRDGHLTEAAAASVHVVIDGEIRTPPRTSRLLPGTTRILIEELAGTHGIPCRSVPVSEAELRAADEIWVGASGYGILPVTRLDDRPVGSGQPGPLWKRMQALIEATWNTHG